MEADSASVIALNGHRIIDLKRRGSSANDVLLLLVYYCLLISPFPTLLAPLGLYLLYSRLGAAALLPFLICCVILLRLPLYYNRRQREGTRPLYNAWANYAKSCKVVLPSKAFPTDKPYVLAMHPHGRVMYSTTLFHQLCEVWGCLLKKGDLFCATAGGFFYLPHLRHAFAAVGCIPASRSAIAKTLRKGDNVMIVVGGVKEVCIPTSPHKDVLYLKKRLGFIRLAMEEKAGVVPVYLFGENQLFQHEPHWWLRLWERLNSFVPIGLPFFRGAWGLPFPYRRDLLMAVGEPLFAKEGESVEAMHARYVAAVEELFHKHVSMSAYPKHKLSIT